MGKKELKTENEILREQLVEAEALNMLAANQIKTLQEQLARVTEQRETYKTALDFAHFTMNELNDLSLSCIKATFDTTTIKEVRYNDRATICFFKDGSKTVAKCHKDDEYSKEIGLYVCLGKKVLEQETNPDIEFLVDSKFTENMRTYRQLSDEDRDVRISALHKWEELEPNVRQSIKAKFHNIFD